MANKNGNNKKNNSNFSIRKLVYNDKYLIIFSIVAAIIIWIITSINLSPITTKTISVPVNVDFSSSVAGKMGLKCYGNDTVDVDVTISCKKYLAKDITADDIAVALQLNSVTAKGVYDVPIKVENKSDEDFDIQSYSPASYSAYFDYEAEKKMNIKIEYADDNFIKEGYIMGEELLSETTATVKGPKTYINNVKSIIAQVNIEDKLDDTQTINIEPKAFDENGQVVSLVTVETESSNPTLTIPVLKQMELDVAVSLTNMPEKFNEDDLIISYTNSKVTAGVLEAGEVNEANIGSIDFSQLKLGTNQFTFQVSNLESIVILEDVKEITATVIVPSGFARKQLTVASKDITLTNIPKNYNASIIKLSSNKIDVIGNSTLLNTEKLSVGMVADLSSNSEATRVGTYEIPITVVLEGTKSCWVSGSYTVTVALTKK